MNTKGFELCLHHPLICAAWSILYPTKACCFPLQLCPGACVRHIFKFSGWLYRTIIIIIHFTRQLYVCMCDTREKKEDSFRLLSPDVLLQLMQSFADGRNGKFFVFMRCAQCTFTSVAFHIIITATSSFCWNENKFRSIGIVEEESVWIVGYMNCKQCMLLQQQQWNIKKNHNTQVSANTVETWMNPSMFPPINEDSYEFQKLSALLLLQIT